MSDDRPSYDELVERLIAKDRECRMTREALAEYAAHDDTTVSYVVALHARIAQLEKNVAKLAGRKS